MNTTDDTTDTTIDDTTDTTPGNTPENMPSDQGRPFGFWIRAVDRLLAAEFATAFEDEGITRRDWRILNVIGGTVPRGREMPDRKLHHLARLGWIERSTDGWALTADGTAARARLTAAVAEIRAQVAGSLEPEEFAAMAASLEKLARGLGYEEGARLPRRPGARPGDEYGRRGHGEYRRDADFGHGEERCGHGEHFDRHLGVVRHAAFGRDERPRYDQHPHREHPHGQHPHREHARRGRGCGAAEGAPTHLHIHLHDGRRNG